MSLKRKISNENCEFIPNSEEKYFFTENNGKPQCLVYLQVISVQPGELCLVKTNEIHSTGRYSISPWLLREMRLMHANLRS